MAYFTRKQLMAFLGLLTSSYVDENSVHDATDNVCIISLTPSRYPSDLVTNHYTEVNFISADESARSDKRRLYSITVRRMNMGREVIECHILAEKHAPKF